MTQAEAISILKAQQQHLAKFGVKSLAIFGSVARDQAKSDSDIDILVEFDGPSTFNQYMDLKFFLEDLLDCQVDLVTSKALRPRIRSNVEREAIYVA